MLRNKASSFITAYQKAHRIMALKAFNRNLHLLKKSCHFSFSRKCANYVYQRQLTRHKIDMYNINLHIKFNVNPRRLFSDMKDDDEYKALMKEIKDDFEREIKLDTNINEADEKSNLRNDELVKSWMKEIKADFEKEVKSETVKSDSSEESTSSGSSSEDEYHSSTSDEDIKGKSDIDKLHKRVEDGIEKLEKLGYTSEEIIEILKDARDSSYDNLIENDFDFEEVVIESIDLEKQNYEKASVNTEGGVEREEDLVIGDQQGDSNQREGSKLDKMEKPDWAVVQLRDNVKTDWSTLEIEDFVNIAETEPEVKEAWKPPVPLVRGKTGVFDIDDLVTVIREANALDVITIRVPAEIDFADYMVIASAKSRRHIEAIAAEVKWIYKRKKHKRDRHLRIEGENSEWYAIDLGNIVLHLFMPEEREKYDLETLWTVGPKYDPQCIQPKDPYVFSVDDLPWLKELEQASKDTEESHDRSNTSQHTDQSGSNKADHSGSRVQ